MRTKVMVLAGVLGMGMLTGCLLVPGRHGRPTLLVPPLPPVVMLESEPYYVQGSYHYHYQNDRWYYADSRSGPWSALPRDRYPREVRYSDGGRGRDGGPPGHRGR